MKSFKYDINLKNDDMKCKSEFDHYSHQQMPQKSKGCSSGCNAPMQKPKSHSQVSCNKNCDIVQGNIVELEISKEDCEVKVDVTVDTVRVVRLWGQVKDCEDDPVRYALVKLVRAYIENGRVKYEGVAHTITDCLGFYQFDVCPDADKCREKYLLIVSKPAIGNERVILDAEQCDPCCDDMPCV